MKKKTALWPYLLLSIALVGIDQLVKLLIRDNFALGETRGFIPGFIQLRYVQNTGAAFSLFNQHTWLLTLLSAVLSVVILWLLVSRRLTTHPLGQATVAVVLAGAVGNLVDRALLGYVTDMFEFTFFQFAVFNVADICICVGGVAFCIYYLFFFEKLEKEDKNGADGTDSRG